MSYNLIISALAEDDLSEIWSYYSEIDVTLADALVSRIGDDLERIGRTPYIGVLRSDLRQSTRLWITDTPYGIFYTILSGRVEILRNLHHARDARRFFG